MVRAWGRGTVADIAGHEEAVRCEELGICERIEEVAERGDVGTTEADLAWYVGRGDGVACDRVDQSVKVVVGNDPVVSKELLHDRYLIP